MARITSTTLNKLNIGQVGVDPEIYFLQTEKTIAEITGIGFIKWLSSVTSILIPPGSFVFTDTNEGNGLYLSTLNEGNVVLENIVSYDPDEEVPTFFVNKDTGNDTTGDGTRLHPYATIAKALTVVGVPVYPVNIIIEQSLTPYTENIVISSPLINLIGSEASLTVGSGTAITVASNGLNIINFSSMVATGAATLIAASGGGTLVVNSDVVDGPITVNATALHYTGNKFDGDLSTSNGGNITYNAGTSTGLKAGLVSGVSSNGVVGETFVVGENITLGDDANLLGVFSKRVEFNFADLNAGPVTALSAANLTAQYQIVGMWLDGGIASTTTNFSGGDKNVTVISGASQYTIIPAAVLQDLQGGVAGGPGAWGAVNGAGVVSLPAPVFVDFSTPTPAGEDILIQYVGGSTNYTGGNGSITFLISRIA